MPPDLAAVLISKSKAQFSGEVRHLQSPWVHSAKMPSLSELAPASSGVPHDFLASSLTSVLPPLHVRDRLSDRFEGFPALYNQAVF